MTFNRLDTLMCYKKGHILLATDSSVILLSLWLERQCLNLIMDTEIEKLTAMG